MHQKYRILVMGASYGSLLGVKLLLAGHTVRLVCLPAEAELINSEGFRVRLPIKGSNELVEIDTRRLPGTVSASGANGVGPAGHGLGALALEDREYAAPGRPRPAGRVAVMGLGPVVAGLTGTPPGADPPTRAELPAVPGLDAGVLHE